jgi:hypothetical protein
LKIAIRCSSKSFLSEGLRTGWPDWPKFRPFGDCVHWTVFLKITDVAENFDLLFATVKVFIKLLKIALGYNFCRFFTNSSVHPDQGRSTLAHFQHLKQLFSFSCGVWWTIQRQYTYVCRCAELWLWNTKVFQ